MLKETLTSSEMEKAVGGSFLDTIGSILNIYAGKLKCEFNSHNYEFTGEYEDDLVCWVPVRYPVLRCTRCGDKTYGTAQAR